MEIDKTEMQPSTSSRRRFEDSLINSDKKKSRVTMNMEIPEDQLACFLNRAMSLHSSPPIGSFASCTERFDGTNCEGQLQKFILNVSVHKNAEGISDETALHELSLLLEGAAYRWWNETKENVHNWQEAINLMKEKFTPKKPPHQIYAELFASKQDFYTTTDIFIGQKRALLAELPQPHPENVQIDMIYWLLKKQIRKKIPRYSISTFNELIYKARDVEQSKKERQMNRWSNYQYMAEKFGLKSVQKCSYCRSRKYKGGGKRDGRQMDCYKCDTQLRKRRKIVKPAETNSNRATLPNFNFSNISFNKYLNLPNA